MKYEHSQFMIFCCS